MIIELHNHTVESDGDFLPTELADYLLKNGIENFALTDHNTISGLNKIENYINANGNKQRFIRGYELTSYYGHILCWNIKNYIPWDDFFKDNADLLFDRVHKDGGLVGIAHPMSAGSPISNGMRFEMKIKDYSKLDFIEIINNAHPMEPDNRKGIDWWEDLYLDGLDIAATSGMDLHRPVDLENTFTTSIFFPRELTLIDESLNYAIKNMCTCVHKRKIQAIRAHIKDKKIFIETGEEKNKYKYLLKTNGKNHVISKDEVKETEHGIYLDVQIKDKSRYVLEVYHKEISEAALVAVTPVLQYR